MTLYEYEAVVHSTNNYDITTLDRFRLCTALSGEVGEFCNVVKKNGTDRTAIDELGDVLWYLTALTHHFGTTLEDVMEVNARKVQSRKALGQTYNQPEAA